MFRFGCQQQQYVYTACCRLYYFYVSIIYGEYLANVHFGDIPHTFIPHFTLHSAEKTASNFPQITPRQISSFYIPQNTPSLWLHVGNPTQLHSLHVGKSCPHPITKTKLTLIVTLTLIQTLTLLSLLALSTKPYQP